MFEVNDILARLQNGEDVQKIADEMAKTLNEANDQYRAAQEAAKQAQETAAAQKVADMNDILAMLEDFLVTYYGEKLGAESIQEAFNDVSAEDAIDAIESIIETVIALSDLEHLIKKPAAKPVKKIVKINNPDEVLSKFLKDMGL